MGLLDSIRKFRDSIHEGMEQARRESQIEAYKKSNPADEYVAMTIMGSGELEKMTRAGWDLVREVPPEDNNPLKDITPAEFLVRKKRDDLRQALGL